MPDNNIQDKTFPHHCNGCIYFETYDLSIDDYTNICHKYKWQVDDIDAYGAFGAFYSRFQVDCYEKE